MLVRSLGKTGGSRLSRRLFLSFSLIARPREDRGLYRARSRVRFAEAQIVPRLGSVVGRAEHRLVAFESLRDHRRRHYGRRSAVFEVQRVHVFTKHHGESRRMTKGSARKRRSRAIPLVEAVEFPARFRTRIQATIIVTAGRVVSLRPMTLANGKAPGSRARAREPCLPRGLAAPPKDHPLFTRPPAEEETVWSGSFREESGRGSRADRRGGSPLYGPLVFYRERTKRKKSVSLLRSRGDSSDAPRGWIFDVTLS